MSPAWPGHQPALPLSFVLQQLKHHYRTFTKSEAGGQNGEWVHHFPEVLAFNKMFAFPYKKENTPRPSFWHYSNLLCRCWNGPNILLSLTVQAGVVVVVVVVFDWLMCFLPNATFLTKRLYKLFHAPTCSSWVYANSLLGIAYLFLR